MFLLFALAACTAPTPDDAALVILDETAREVGVFVEVDGIEVADALPVAVRAEEPVVVVTPDTAIDLALAAGEVVLVQGEQANLSWHRVDDDLDPDAVAVQSTEEAAFALAELLGADGFTEVDGLRVIDAPDALFGAAGLGVDPYAVVPITLAGEPLRVETEPSRIRCACDMGLPDLETHGTGTPTTVTVVHEIVLDLPDDDLLRPAAMPTFVTSPEDVEEWTTGGGTQVRSFWRGEGPGVGPYDSVTVEYRGWLPDGTVFDSTEERGPATFPLSALIEGWREGLLGMQPGERRQLVIPPEQGYGDRDMAVIPAGSTLLFEVDLLTVEAGQAWTP